MAVKTPITIAYGDGIGPEIMEATLSILKAANADLEYEVIEIGKKVYEEGFTSGIPDAAWESLLRTKVLLKAPITTPQGGGYKSLNVTLRKTLSLYANVRPTIAYAPYVATKFPHMNLVIIRENEEGTYSGIEHRQTDEVYQCLKLVTRPGCERIVHYAFEYARKFNRKKVTCLTKDNIMKMTDGIFHQVFNELATEYPDIQNEHLIIDIGTALVATDPDRFDVIVTSNLYGDILSDVAAQIGGSVGLAGSANVGNHMAMFEAIHGSAPDIAGKKIANPSGLLNAAIQMLIHINQPETATKIQNAWLLTLEEGIHTADIYTKEYSKKKVNTDEFAAAVVANLGKQPTHFPVADYKETKTKIECYGEVKKPLAKKELVGIDIFIDNPNMTPEQIGEKLSSIKSLMQLITITSRGLKIWPDSMIKAPYAQHCSCRFQSSKDVKN
jgi:isocitrate dehydrogenase